MLVRRLLPPALALLAAATAHAGVVYHVTTTIESGRSVMKSSGRMWVDGPRYRFEPDPGSMPPPFDVAISNDGDTTVLYYHKKDARWTERGPHASGTRSSMLFHLPFPNDRVVGPAVVLRRLAAGKEIVAGVPTEKHVLDVSYKVQVDVEGSPVVGQVRARAEIWTAPSLPAFPFRRSVQTGFAQVDRRIAEALREVPGMVLRHELTVSRTLEDGPTVTETIRTVIDDLRVQEVPESMFATPYASR